MVQAPHKFMPGGQPWTSACDPPQDYPSIPPGSSPIVNPTIHGRKKLTVVKIEPKNREGTTSEGEFA